METYKAKRVEIIIEAPMERRLSKKLDEAGVKGYTILPVWGGSGRSGPWNRTGQVSSAGGMVAFICIVAPDRTEALLETVYGVVARHIGVVSLSDCEVVRKERF
jgi:nitrogen regulatory protein PII